MPSSISEYGRDFIIQAVFGQTQSVTGNYFLGLTQFPPDTVSDATGLAEPSTGGYVRVAIPNTAAGWAFTGGGFVSNAAAVSFPVASADWLPVSYYVLCTAATGGNWIVYGDLQTSLVVASGHQLIFQPGQLSISVVRAARPVLGA